MFHFSCLIVILNTVIVGAAATGQGTQASGANPAVAASNSSGQGAGASTSITTMTNGLEKAGPVAPGNSASGSTSGTLESRSGDTKAGRGALSDNVPGAKPPVDTGAATADSELQAEIQRALSKEPSLGGSSVRVTENGIELSGSVATSRDKVTAGRLALSYAASRKLTNRITVTGRATNPSAAAHSADHGASWSSVNQSRRQDEVNQVVSPTSNPGSSPPRR